MSLLQEMQKHGLADCEFNRTLLGDQTMKYYIGKIEEINGEFEYGTEYLFKTNADPHKFTKKIAMEWRGSSKSDWDKDQEGYWCDHTLICNNGFREVPEDDFVVLSKYLPVM